MSICFQRLLATLVLVAAAWTDDARAEELSSAEKEASAMLESYTASFASKSAEEMIPFFHIPMLAVFDTGVVAMNRNLDIVRYVQSIQSKLTEMDYAYSNWTKLRIKELNSGLVVASTSAIRYNRDGGIIAETGSTYVLRKAEDGWKIATFISHAPDRVLPLD
jgi:ketosteroid isomerase-like protein